MAHDVRGRPVVDRQVITLGLSAAVLAELLLTGFATINSGVLVPGRDGEPLDVIAAVVMRRLRTEWARLPVQEWLLLLADARPPGQNAYDYLGERLEQSRHVRRAPAGLLGRSTRYVPLDTEAWPWGRLTGRLCQDTSLSRADTVLAGLILATGLHQHVLLGHPGTIENRLRHHVAAAPDEIGHLVGVTEMTVAAVTSRGQVTR